MSPSTGSVPLGNYMSFPLFLFPSEITCPLLCFCSLRMLHVSSAGSVPFGNSADHCFSSSPHTVSASSQVLIRYIFTFLSVFFIKPLRVFPGQSPQRCQFPARSLLSCSAPSEPKSLPVSPKVLLWLPRSSPLPLSHLSHRECPDP